MTKQQVLMISLSGILIFGLLLSGKILYQKQWVDSSIASQVQKIPGVVTAKTVEVNGQAEMDVTTKHIEDLRQVSLSLENIAGKEPIRYLDHRNDTLTQLFEQMQFAIQEGISQGNFTEMDKNLRALAEKSGVQLELEMDSEAIYVSLNQNNSQLIEVVERHDQGQFLPTNKLSQ